MLLPLSSLGQLTVNVTGGEVPPLTLVTCTVYSLDRISPVRVQLVREAPAVLDPVAILDGLFINIHSTRYCVAPFTPSQDTVTDVHVMAAILTLVGAATVPEWMKKKIVHVISRPASVNYSWLLHTLEKLGCYMLIILLIGY